MLLWLLVIAGVLFVLQCLIVMTVAEIGIHPPVVRRPCDTDGMALHVAHATGANPQLIHLEASDGVKLSAWWLHLPDSKHAVMVCHGVADTAFGVMGAALMFLRNGYSVLAPDNRGHGGSGGFVTYGLREAADLAGWQAWMDKQAVLCFGFGESLEASSLLQSLTCGARFEAIVAECPFSSFERVVWDRILRLTRHALPLPFAKLLSNFWTAQILLYLKLRYRINLWQARPVDSVLGSAIPILLIHGTADFETPAHHSQEIAAANPDHVRLWLAPGADHTGGYAADAAEFEAQVFTVFPRLTPR